MYTYAGNIHIHSTYSDGTGTIPEIAVAAREAGLDYIIITDHQDVRPLQEEGNYQGVMVVTGIELNSRANHYLALGIEEDVGDYSHNPQETIDQVNRQGGFGFLAHPFEKGSPYITKGSACPWNDFSVKDFTGIEIWNYSSQWKSKSQSLLKMLYWYFFCRDGPILSGPPPDCLQWWDRLTKERPVVAIGGTDAHQIYYRMGPVNTVIFPYRYLFSTINTYLLLEDKLHKNFVKARHQILQSLRKGQCYLSMDRVYSGHHFYFGAFNQNSEVPMGSSLKFDEQTFLRIASPHRRSLIRVIKNGKLVEEKSGPQLLFRVLKPGTFRVEIHFKPLLGKSRPWIYSNPVYIQHSPTGKGNKGRGGG